MAQITWERSLDVLGAAQKVMVDTLKLIAVPGAGALAAGDDLLDAAWGSLKQSFTLAEDAYVYEAEKRQDERRERLAGLQQVDLKLPPGERTLVAWKNEQGVAIKAWEEGETAAPVELQPGEEMTCFNPEKVAWTVLTPATGSRRKKTARVELADPRTASEVAADDVAPALEEEAADAPA